MIDLDEYWYCTYVREKHILLYLCEILKPGTLRTAEIYSILVSTWHFFRFQGIANILRYVSTLFVWYSQLCQTIFFEVGIGFHKTCHFSDFKELQIFQVMFSTLFVWYTKLCQSNILYKYWFPHDLSFFIDFKELQIFRVMFSTLFVWYTQLCIGFHRF